MQGVFHEMGLQQTEGSLRLVRAGLSWLDPSHAARAYMATAPDLAFDTGMVDTFLHGRDVSFTVRDCLDLVERSGLVFQDWFQKTALHPPTLVEPENEFLAAVSPLPERQMWSVMERLRNLTACHLFTACRRERATAEYVIDFSAPHAVNYVPLWRMRAGIDGQLAVRPSWAIPLAEHHRELALQVDSDRSIAEIADRCAQPVAEALELFRQLWRLDFIAIDVNNANP